LEEKPLSGFSAVEKSFTHVWVLVRHNSYVFVLYLQHFHQVGAEVNYIIDVLEKADDIPETIEVWPIFLFLNLVDIGSNRQCRNSKLNSSTSRMVVDKYRMLWIITQRLLLEAM
jgi:hypothetical protein